MLMVTYYDPKPLLNRDREERKKLNTKAISILILVVLAIGTVSTVFSIGTVAAADTQKTYAISDAIPDRIGLGESTLLKCGITEALASQAYGWSGITITVVKPNGDTETLGPFTTDSTGSTYTTYTPDQIGTYNLTTNFPQQEMPVNTTSSERGSITIVKGTIMLASTATSQLIVTQEPTPQYPGHALPTEYWSRPIDPQLREWASISGNWVARPDNSLAPYNEDAPETAHVLWAHQLTTGGLVGGIIDDVPVAAESGDAYEGKFPGSVILNGILYYQRTDTRRELAPAIMAVDLHTGEEWMFKNNTVLSFGQEFYFNSYNMDGVFSYIWSVTGSTYTAYDPFTGNQQMQITNVPVANVFEPTRFVFRTFGPSGEILIYQIDVKNGWMSLWNSTDCGLQNAVIGTPDYGSWGNTAHGTAKPNNNYGHIGLNGSDPRCFTWNVSIPAGINAIAALGSASVKIYPDDRVVGMYFNQTKVNVWGLETKGLTNSSTAAKVLFNEWWNAPTEWYNGTNTLAYTGATNNVKGGVIAVWDKELRTHYGFSVETGKYLWATSPEVYLDSYGWGNAEHTWYFAYGKLYSVGVGGILYAYDLTNGKTAWTYNMTDAYGEPITGNNWWGWIALIADQKIYIGTLEHSAENPLPRGAPYIAVNASNGAEIFRVNGMFRETRWGGNSVIGDSIIATMDTYDQRVYGIGKGPSQTMVNAPGSGITLGGSVTITGTVTDISPGTQTSELKMRFPNGVAAVSDASMSDWMLHVYKQFEQAANTTGVPVSIYVVDANNNYRQIGTTTTDADGYFAFSWTPDIAGAYRIYAIFEGSAGYYASHAQSAFTVDNVPQPTGTTTPTVSLPPFEMYIIGMGVAIIVVVAIATLLILRKK